MSMSAEVQKNLEYVRSVLTDVRKYINAANVVSFDLETVCPPKGLDEQGDVCAFLENQAFKLKKDPAFSAAAEFLYTHREELSELDRLMAESLHREYLKSKNLTPEKQEQIAKAQKKAYTSWLSAKEKSDYGLFRENLREVRDLAIEEVSLREESLPASLIHLTVDAEGIPASLPADSSFDMFINLLEKIFPNFGAIIHGETKKDGSLLLTVRKPDNNGMESEEIFCCTGTLVPAAARDIPNYMQKELDGVYNVFSFNEQTLAEFRNKVLPLLVRSIFRFVEAAPTSACQSLLDDLTDSGILDMVMKY